MRQKRNFIKNIRPDSFKRPSSFSVKEAEIAGVRKTDKDCVLVGYRKTIASPNIHNQVVINNLELGTFSPVVSSSESQVPNFMSNSVSLPSLVRSNFGKNSDGALPDYVRVARRSLRAKKKSRHPRSIITVDIGGSDPDIKGNDDENDDDEDDDLEGKVSGVTTRKLKRALTDPARRTSSSSYSDSSRETTLDRKVISKKPPVPDNPSDNTQPEGDSSVKKHLNFEEEPLKNLSRSIGQVLDQDLLNDSDRSDDDTCIQNGFDEELEPLKFSKPSTVDNNHPGTSGMNMKASNRAADSRNKNDVADSNTLAMVKSDNHVVKSNELIVNQHSTDKQNSTQESSRTSVEDVLSVTEISIAKDRGCSDTVSVSHSESSLTVTGSQTTLTSKESGIAVDIISDRDIEVVKDSDKEVTVLELLREEYKRDMNISVSDFSDSGVSGVSMKNNYKSSSDSNLLQSVDATGSSDNLSIKKSTDVMTTSASFPDIYKLSEPKLVDKIGRSTIR